MTGAARLVVLCGASLALLAACGSPAPSSPTPSPTVPPATPTTAATPIAPAPTEADLQAVYVQLYPPSRNGGDCGGSSTPAWSACPLTARLIAALNASLARQNGPGGEPLCGCQALDPMQTASYAVGTPPGGGTIHIAGFGGPHIAYVVVPSNGAFLVDDIVYCSPSPHSIYPTETVTSC